MAGIVRGLGQPSSPSSPPRSSGWEVGNPHPRRARARRDSVRADRGRGSPSPLIIAAAALVGYLAGMRLPGLLGTQAREGGDDESTESPPETGLRRRFAKPCSSGSSPSPHSCSPVGSWRVSPASSRSPPS